jgi:transketolase
VLIDCSGLAEALVIATGSEVGLAAQAVNSMNGSGRRIRLISMPATEVFDAQDESYRESVLPRAVTRRLAVEAGARQSFWRYIGGSERVVGIDRFGASGKGADVFPHFGFTADNIVLQIR